MLSCHGLREGSEEERGKKKEEGKNGARALSLARKAHPASHPRRLTPCPMRVPGPFPSCRPPESAVCAARSIAASVRKPAGRGAAMAARMEVKKNKRRSRRKT